MVHPMTTTKIFSQELIGRTIEIISSPHQSVEKMKGKVIDETKSTLRIDCDGKIRTLLKGSITFLIVGSQTIIRGRDIIKRPEERIKG